MRDPEKWYDSAISTIFQFEDVVLRTWFAKYLPKYREILKFDDAAVAGPAFGGVYKLLDKQHVIDTFKQHVEEVKRTVPKEQLLLFDVKEGWEPLCKFLNKPVPKTPFPRTNEQAEFQAQNGPMMQEIKLYDRLLTGLVAVTAVGLGVLGFTLGKRRGLF